MNLWINGICNINSDFLLDLLVQIIYYFHVDWNLSSFSKINYKKNRNSNNMIFHKANTYCTWWHTFWEIWCIMNSRGLWKQTPCFLWRYASFWSTWPMIYNIYYLRVLKSRLKANPNYPLYSLCMWSRLTDQPEIRSKYVIPNWKSERSIHSSTKETNEKDFLHKN